MSNKRKGVTLAEMSIVMAVIAIVSLSVVSFVTITSGRGTASIGKLNAMEEIELVEAIVDSWFAQTVLTDDSIVINDKKVQINGSSAIYMDRKTLKVDFPGGGNETTDYRLERVKKIVFDYEESPSSDDVLYFCTVTYEYEEDGASQTYTFCINPRVGEIVEEIPMGEITKPTEPTEPTEPNDGDIRGDIAE